MLPIVYLLEKKYLRPILIMIQIPILLINMNGIYGVENAIENAVDNTVENAILSAMCIAVPLLLQENNFMIYVSDMINIINFSFTGNKLFLIVSVLQSYYKLKCNINNKNKDSDQIIDNNMINTIIALINISMVLLNNKFITIIWMILYLFYINRTSNIMNSFYRKQRIYCCGVFDMLHEGHCKLFERAASYGTVVVGVLSDQTVESYKRTPIMNTSERVRFVRLMKYVEEVIVDCPLYTTKEFMDQYNIDQVIISEEYFTPPYKYYEDCVANNQYIVFPRTEGVSTTDIMKRIATRENLKTVS